MIQKKFFFLIFKHRFRRRALNNFIKIKKIKNYHIFDLTGFLKYYFFGKILIFLISKLEKFFENFILISCDLKPFIKKNGVNIWFGGTSYKVPNEYKLFKNNCFVFENFSKKEENLINLYPFDPIEPVISKNPSVVFVGSFNIIEDQLIDKIWNVEKDKILNDLTIIDKFEFWEKYNLDKDKRLQAHYIQLKERVRFNLILNIKKNLKDKFIVVGTKWKEHVSDAKEDEFNELKIKELYNGQICIDFGSKWGSNIFYPRSVEIIESGGFLLQLKQNNSSSNLYKLDAINEFDSLENCITKLNKLIFDNDFFKKKLENQFKFFSNKELNYETLNQIYEISKKNN